MRLLGSIVFAVFVSSSAFAGQYMSAHFCQPYQHGGQNLVELYYQSQGSIYAAKETTVSCPITMQSNNAQQHVKLYYQSANVSGSPAVACTFWKIMSTGLTQVSPQVVSQPNLNAGAFDIYSPNGTSDTIGMNLNCNLKAGAKILGYFVY